MTEFLALVLPEDGHGAVAELAPDAVAAQPRLVAAAPDARRATPRSVAGHVEEERGHEGVGHLLTVHLLDPLGRLHGVVDDREVRELRRLRLLDGLEDDTVLPVPVRTEVDDLDDDPVGRERLGALDSLHAVVVDVLRVGRLPLAVLLAPRLAHALARVHDGGGDGLAVDRDDDVEERVLPDLGLVAGDRPVLHRRGERGVDVGRVDAGPRLHHRDLVRERGEATVDELERGLLAHEGEHETDDARVVVELQHVFGGEASRREMTLERFPVSLLQRSKASHDGEPPFWKAVGRHFFPAGAEMMQAIG